MPSSSTIKIDLDAIEQNLSHLIAAFGHVMVMVKGNGYGTDSVVLSKFLQSSSDRRVCFLGVSHVVEGVRLREEGITLPIFVLAAPIYEAESVVKYHLTPAVSTFEEVEALNRASQRFGRATNVHLHLCTGMNRFGISPHQGMDLYEVIERSSYLHLEGVMTHFIAAETPTFDALSYRQINLFQTFIKSLPSLPRWIHAGNSGGAVRFPMPFCNLVRIGLGTFGIGCCLPGSQLALQFTTKLAAVKKCTQGETVGYHCNYSFDQGEGVVGVIPVGYHDGFLRSLCNQGYVLIRGKKAPMIGTVCMDFMMVNLTLIPEATVGDEVCIFGPELPPETLAQWAKTDVREILASIPARIRRQWINSSNGREYELSNPERISSPLFSLKKDTTP
jgi:Alr-MurF fusion protein